MSKLEELPKESLIAEIEQLREDYKVASDALRDKEKQVKLLKDRIELLESISDKNDRLLAIIEQQSESIRDIIPIRHDI